ncbi:ATP-dependent protease La domain-containing protein [Cyathus striatus]|nr:ATP-dependent protease La domain-containing protein [Cyathus striatus]
MQERKLMDIPAEVHVHIAPRNLKDCVGPPTYQKDLTYASPPPPGVSTGLGYLGSGSGAVMSTEAISMPGKGGLQLTGKLGEVIQESANVGLSWVKAHTYDLGITESLTTNSRKEGPGAGAVILSVFASLFTKTKVDQDMGEYPLRSVRMLFLITSPTPPSTLNALHPRLNSKTIRPATLPPSPRPHRRPLFPGFYKAVVIRNPSAVAALKEMTKQGQPYLGTFLPKDPNPDASADIITNLDRVHPVGVFTQITSAFAVKNADGEGLIAVLYPHRRIRIAELVKAGDAEEEKKVKESMPFAPISFLHKFLISIVNVENLTTLPYNEDDQYIRVFMSEIVSAFKDIAQLNPLFRDQITNFSINQAPTPLSLCHHLANTPQIASNVFDEPDKLADFAAAVSTGEVQEPQDVPKSLSVPDRFRKSLVIKKELINAQLQSKLSRDIDSKIAKRQREYYLMEQLKNILDDEHPQPHPPPIPFPPTPITTTATSAQTPTPASRTRTAPGGHNEEADRGDNKAAQPVPCVAEDVNAALPSPSSSAPPTLRRNNNDPTSSALPFPFSLLHGGDNFVCAFPTLYSGSSYIPRGPSVDRNQQDRDRSD